MKKIFFTIILILSNLIGQDSIGTGLFNEDLISFLRENYKTNTTLGYNNARDTLYSVIDIQDGQVKGIYTNFSVNLPSDVDPSTYLYENGINCEHVWPQSLYEGSEPIKSDLHALRPCKDNVNSSRGNKPFNEIDDIDVNSWYWLDNQTSNIPSSNIDEYSENHGSFFEPREDRKGDIARTIFYFYTMYSESADEDFFAIQKDILFFWHINDPVNEEEYNRTWHIAEYQENKPNPFILDETLIERAYFFEGFDNGDINFDGEVNVLDIVAIVGIIINEDEYDFTNDLNQDGETNILDVVILVGIILS